MISRSTHARTSISWTFGFASYLSRSDSSSVVDAELGATSVGREAWATGCGAGTPLLAVTVRSTSGGNSNGATCGICRRDIVGGWSRAEGAVEAEDVVSGPGVSANCEAASDGRSCPVVAEIVRWFCLKGT
jgi:hypothetical protein